MSPLDLSGSVRLRSTADERRERKLMGRGGRSARCVTATTNHHTTIMLDWLAIAPKAVPAQ